MAKLTLAEAERDLRTCAEDLLVAAEAAGSEHASGYYFRSLSRAASAVAMTVARVNRASWGATPEGEDLATAEMQSAWKVESDSIDRSSYADLLSLAAAAVAEGVATPELPSAPRVAVVSQSREIADGLLYWCAKVQKGGADDA